MERQSTVQEGRPPLISVVLPTYNRREYIRESLESVLNQSFSDFEVIVVDDGSTDGTEEVLRPYIDPALPGSRVRYIRQENRGAAGARNTGIRNARGTYIAFMDSGDLSTSNHLQTLYNFLNQNLQYAMVLGNGAYLEGKYHNRRTVIPQKRAKRLEESGVTVSDVFDGRAVRLQGTMARKEVLEEVGLLDERFRICHDLDLAFRVIKNHWLGFINEVVFLYRKHGGHIAGDDELRSRENLRALEELISNYPEALELIGKRAFFCMVAHRYYRLAKALARKGEMREAREAMTQAVALRPLSPRYRLYQFLWM